MSLWVNVKSLRVMCVQMSWYVDADFNEDNIYEL